MSSQEGGNFYNTSQDIPLGEKVIKGGMWVFSLQILTRVLVFVKLIILARLLVPEDFGVFGIALLTVAVLETFSQTGFQAALIQRKGDIRPYLDTAWVVQILRGSLLAGILIVISPYVAYFFNEPSALQVLRIIALYPLFRGFTNIGVVYFQKDLEFHRQFLYQLTGILVDTGVAIILAVLLRNVWALILGVLASGFAQMLISYTIHSYKPKLRIDIEKAKGLFNFGRWIFGRNVLAFLITQGDDIFLGKMLGVSALGLYQIAYRISNLPATEITFVVGQVTFPAYSKIQDKLSQLRQAFLQTLQIISFVSFPLAGGIFFLAGDFTHIFLGEKWLAMIPAMKVLTIWGLIRSIKAIPGSLLAAIGRPDIPTKLQAVKLLILAGLIYPLTVKWGILGTSLSVVISALIVDPIYLLMANRVIRYTLRELLHPLGLPFLGTVVTVCILFVIRYTLLGHQGVAILTLYIGVGIIVYLLMTWLFEHLFDYNIRKTLKERIFSMGRFDKIVAENRRVL